MSREIKFIVLTMLAMTIAGCNRTPAETSLGIDNSTFHCEGEKCDVVFFLDNQSPNSVAIEYRAELTNEYEEVVSEFSGEVEVPMLEKIKVSKTVTVIARPDRLRVRIANLQHM